MSAHYVVKEDGSEVSQLVDEARNAWHVAADYRSNLNESQLRHLQGKSVNHFSIGIEHGGYGRQRTFPTAQIDRSIALVRDITARHNIPRDRYHIVGHGQLQPETRVDPGANWPWGTYLRKIAGDTGSQNGSGGTVITIDDETEGRFSASSAWYTSTWASGRVGERYRYRAPGRVSDTAKYRVPIRAAGNYEVYARVPGNGFNTSIPYLVHHRAGTTSVTKDVSAAGATWLSLGRYNFDAGDDWVVEVSAWTAGEGWIVADAIRFVAR